MAALAYLAFKVFKAYNFLSPLTVQLVALAMVVVFMSRTVLLVNPGVASPPKFAEALQKPHLHSHLAGTKALYTMVWGDLSQKQWVCGGILVRKYNGASSHSSRWAGNSQTWTFKHVTLLLEAWACYQTAMAIMAHRGESNMSAWNSLAACERSSTTSSLGS